MWLTVFSFLIAELINKTWVLAGWISEPNNPIKMIKKTQLKLFLWSRSQFATTNLTINRKSTKTQSRTKTKPTLAPLQPKSNSIGQVCKTLQASRMSTVSGKKYRPSGRSAKRMELVMSWRLLVTKYRNSCSGTEVSKCRNRESSWKRIRGRTWSPFWHRSAGDAPISTWISSRIHYLRICLCSNNCKTNFKRVWKII